MHSYFYRQVHNGASFRRNPVLHKILTTIEGAFILLSPLLPIMLKGRYVLLSRFSADQMEALFVSALQICEGRNHSSISAIGWRVEAVVKSRMMSVLLHDGKKNIVTRREQYAKDIKCLGETVVVEHDDRDEAENIVKNHMDDDIERLWQKLSQAPQRELDIVGKHINARAIGALMYKRKSALCAKINDVE